MGGMPSGGGPPRWKSLRGTRCLWKSVLQPLKISRWNWTLLWVGRSPLCRCAGPPGVLALGLLPEAPHPAIATAAAIASPAAANEAAGRRGRRGRSDLTEEV